MERSAKVLLTYISIVHAISHIHIMTLPALLPILPKAIHVSFMELGIAIGVFNVVSLLVQAPFGFLVDRLGARKMLIYALLLGTVSFTLVFISTSYISLIVAMALAGVANGVYHPANYALLSTGILTKQMGRAFSIHIFSGFFGAAITPLMMIGIGMTFGINWAFALAAVISFVGLLLMLNLSQIHIQPRQHDKKQQYFHAEVRPHAIHFSTIAILTLFFTLLSLSTGAIEKFSVSSLIDGLHIDLNTANYALTAFMFSGAFGVLAGGIIADKVQHHSAFAATAFGSAALVLIIIICIPMSALALVASFACAGFLMGVIAPSRDMLVRKASPVGAEGRTFGIVSTGFNLGGVIGPLIFGFLLDKKLAIGVMWLAVIFILLTVVIIFIQEVMNKKIQKFSGYP